MAATSLRRNAPEDAPARQQQQSNMPLLTGTWDPFRRMERLLRWEPFLAPPGALGRQDAQLFFPNFDVEETRDAYLFKADLPGVREADIEISVSGNQLTISGRREEAQEEDVQSYFVYERTYGTFARTFALPQGADVEHIRADLKDGVLSLIVPKRPEVQPRRVALGEKKEDGNKPEA